MWMKKDEDATGNTICLPQAGLRNWSKGSLKIIMKDLPFHGRPSWAVSYEVLFGRFVFPQGLVISFFSQKKGGKKKHL